MLQRVARAGAVMQRMINDLLDLTRGRLGSGLPIALQNIDLRVLANETVEDLALRHPDRELRFSAAGDLEGEWDAQT